MKNTNKTNEKKLALLGISDLDPSEKIPVKSIRNKTVIEKAKPPYLLYIYY
jgi:hypothetical protein